MQSHHGAAAASPAWEVAAKKEDILRLQVGGNHPDFPFLKGPDSAQLAGVFNANLLSPKALNPSKVLFMGTDALREAEASQSRRQLKRSLLPCSLATGTSHDRGGNSPHCPWVHPERLNLFP